MPTTVATSVATSELYRGDLSSMALSVSEALYWDNGSSVGSHHYPYGKLASIIRDRKPSEVESYGLDHPPPHPVSPPRKFAYIGGSPLSGSVESLSRLGPRCPVHRPRNSLDAPSYGCRD